jgi:Cu/Ag efflux pump CusA
LEGTKEIGLAVLATTFSIVAVFLPIGFMQGIIGKFFHEFGLTIVVAVLISMFVSFILDPMLSSVWHDPSIHRGGQHNPQRSWYDMTLGRVTQWFEDATEALGRVYQRMLGFFLDEEVGDILSPSEGFDLKVTISKAPGKQFNDTMVDPARRPSKLHEDSAVAQKWLDNIPNLDDMYRLKSTQEIEAVLNNWLNGGSTEVSQDSGSSRGAAPSDELDNLVAEVKSPAAPKSTKKLPAEKVDVKKQSLDDAFADLIGDD